MGVPGRGCGVSPRKIGPLKSERTAAIRATRRTYLLRDVPEESWQGLRRAAYEQEATLREVILRYVREGIERDGGKADRDAKGVK